MAEIGLRAREAAGDRSIVMIAENEPQDTRLVRPLDEGGYGLDAVWNDDFHHSAMVALTGRSEAYYSDTRGEPQELISAAKYGYLFQGQHYDWQRQPRGRPAWGLRPAAFVTFLQNHDQIANSARRLRGHQIPSPARCTPICCGCAARSSPSVPSSPAAWTARCCRRRRSRSASSRPIIATIGSSS